MSSSGAFNELLSGRVSICCSLLTTSPSGGGEYERKAPGHMGTRTPRHPGAQVLIVVGHCSEVRRVAAATV